MTEPYRYSRDSNIELMRVIMMLFIVFLHSIHSSGILPECPTRNVFVPVYTVRAFLLVAVNCYVLISGYYGIKFKSRKLLSLYLEVFFYCVLAYFVHLVVDGQHFGKSFLFNSLFCISHSKLWFVESYFLLYLISPILNKAICACTKGLLLFYIIILTVINIYFGYLWDSRYIVTNGFSLIQFIWLYFVGFYIGKFVSRDFIYSNGRKFLLAYVVLSFIWTAISTVTMDQWTLLWRARQYNNPVIFVSSISCFLFFLSLPKSFKHGSSLVNFVSSGTFAVYIVHMSTYIFPWFDKLIKYLGSIMNDSFPIICELLVLLLVSLGVMMVIVVIDYFRRILMNPVLKRINPIVDQLESRVKLWASI